MHAQITLSCHKPIRSTGFFFEQMFPLKSIDVKCACSIDDDRWWLCRFLFYRRFVRRYFRLWKSLQHYMMRGKGTLRYNGTTANTKCDFSC